MKKYILLVAASCFLASFSSFAQNISETEDELTRTVVEETMTPEGKIVTTTVYEKNYVFTNGFWKNWTLGGAFGGQLYYGDNDWKVNNWTEMFTFPAFDFYLTKWASPSFGVGLGVSGFKFKGLYQTTHNENLNPHFQTNELYKDLDPKYDYQKLAYQRGNYMNIYVAAHADLGNVFFGYKPNRFFDIDAYMGGGLIYGFGTDYNYQGATFNAGLINMFRLSKKLNLLINLRGALVSDEFDGESYIKEPDVEHIKANVKYDGNFGATIGLSYRLGKDTEWNIASRSSEIHYNDQLLANAQNQANQLASQLADAQKANADLQNQFNELEKAQYIKEMPDLWFHINFTIDKWDIVKREMINLQSIAEIMKKSPNSKFLICGYADKQTATHEHNMELSKNRVEAVYNTLVNEFGVEPEKLVTDYKGGVDYMFYNEAELSRCVMINTIK